MKVSDISFDQLKVGDQVIGARGTWGVIEELVEEGARKEPEVVIQWCNGKHSRLWHHLCEEVWVLNHVVHQNRTS